MPSIGSKQRARRKEEMLQKRTPEQIAADAAEDARKKGVGVACVHCGRLFPSRNKMFKHLQQGMDGGEACMLKARDDGMPVAKQTERVAVLLAYAGEKYAGAGSSYQGHHWQSDGIHGEVERLLWEAVHAVDERDGSPGKVARFSRASRTDRGLHSFGNVVCLAANRLVDPAAAQAWVERVNEKLPEDLRVLGRWPVENDFHAKNSVEKRRYEMLVPLHTLVAEDPASAAATAERSAQAEWRWEVPLVTADPTGWTLAQPPAEAAGVAHSCTSGGLAIDIPATADSAAPATALVHCALPSGPVALNDNVYAEWWQQHLEGHGLGPSVQLVLGLTTADSGGGGGDVTWFCSAEQFETVSALDTLQQRELKICQPLASRMGWLSFDLAACSVPSTEPQRLPANSLVCHVGWLVTGDGDEGTAIRFSGLRLAECALQGPFMWHADATTTDRLRNSEHADAVASDGAQGEQPGGGHSVSPESKRMRTAEGNATAPPSGQHQGAKGESGGVRNWGLYRLRLLARLKGLIKRFEGDELHAYHNFSEGVSSTEARAKKRVSRCHCRGIVQLGPSLECVVLTFQALEDGFLYNQLRKMVGLLVAVARGDVPEPYIRLALDENAVLPVPCAPAHLGALADCIYTRKIVRANFNEPGEIKQPTGDRDNAVNFNAYRSHETAAWRARLHAHMADLERDLPAAALTGEADSITGSGGGRWDRWVQDMLYDESSATCVTRMTRELTFYSSRHHGNKGANIIRAPIPTAVPGMFRHMLCLLREAEQSGRWPASSISRRNVIDKNSKRGESFALGRMPAHLKQPAANDRFPELMQAAIALEHLLMPERPPSSTFVVNKHAQFKPHKDSGAGAGQHVSMIVGLGDYSGGELVVEGSVNDIRYKALEFDGWNQRHWTLPFDGERFSIVWFTPLGCEDVAPTPPEVAEAVAACEAASAARAGAMVARATPEEGAAASTPSLEQPQWAVELHPQQQSGAAGSAGASSCPPILMPLVGIGTYRLRGLDTSKAVSAALGAGCRLIDTAASYGNEAEIGAVLRDEVRNRLFFAQPSLLFSLHRMKKRPFAQTGSGQTSGELRQGRVSHAQGSLKGDCAVLREHIFLTSKLRPQDSGYEKTLKAFHATVDRLGVDYLDLYLIHWPGTAKLAPTSPKHKENRLGSWVKITLTCLPCLPCLSTCRLARWTDFLTTCCRFGFWFSSESNAGAAGGRESPCNRRIQLHRHAFARAA
jgi:tRNA U38,U39,U40 pseudouridine synthase TruA